MKVMGVDGILTGISGQEATPEAEIQWRKERAAELLGKQKTENAAMDKWNSAFRKPKSYRRNSK